MCVRAVWVQTRGKGSRRVHLLSKSTAKEGSEQPRAPPSSRPWESLLSLPRSSQAPTPLPTKGRAVS